MWRPPVLVIRAYKALEHTRRPAQTGDLYLIVGQLCGLLASASFDLGYWSAAVGPFRAAYMYGELLGHDGLRAWARGMHAVLANWSGQPMQALELVRAGQQYAPRGTATLRLRCIEARSHAQLGSVLDTVRAVEAAEAEREHIDGTDELHDLVGGQFAFGPARRAMSNGSALLQIGQASAAAAQAEQVLAASPRNDPSAWDFIVAGARADLAAARLLEGDFDAATAAGRQPCSATTTRTEMRGVIGRMKTVRHALAGPTWQRHQPARELAARVEDFTALDASRGLPAAPSAF